VADEADPGPSGFEEHRADLLRVAYRLLGSHSDAEDAVQEAWLRWNAADRTRVDPRGWLVTVTGRICLDVLRSARVRRESYVGPWLPEPVVQALPAGEDPADTVVRGEKVSYALLVVMERLTPDQRVAFVLHDAFGVGRGGTSSRSATCSRRSGRRGPTSSTSRSWASTGSGSGTTGPSSTASE
jgi:RNA polymerase sigma-70 factor (ECF subfamily)